MANGKIILHYQITYLCCRGLRCNRSGMCLIWWRWGRIGQSKVKPNGLNCRWKPRTHEQPLVWIIIQCRLGIVVNRTVSRLWYQLTEVGADADYKNRMFSWQKVDYSWIFFVNTWLVQMKNWVLIKHRYQLDANCCWPEISLIHEQINYIWYSLHLSKCYQIFILP